MCSLACLFAIFPTPPSQSLSSKGWECALFEISNCFEKTAVYVAQLHCFPTEALKNYGLGTLINMSDHTTRACYLYGAGRLFKQWAFSGLSHGEKC